MKRYRLLILVLLFVALAGFIALRRGQVSAQSVNVKVTPTTVSRTFLYKINPGQRPAFDQDVMTNLIPVFEEEKKAGILTGYQFFNNVTADNPSDWNVGMLLSYANYAALDGLGDRVDPIELKHYGSAPKRQAAGGPPKQSSPGGTNRVVRMGHSI